VTLLIATGAAMAANCEPCLNKVVPDLIEAGVTQADIRAAVEIGQYVKDRPAAVMKQAADVLAGTRLSEGPEATGCPAGAMKQATR
jgi:alkylhydroperoxidase/carboxymuconolactone decarboxylase family protein YurZ